MQHGRAQTPRRAFLRVPRGPGSLYRKLASLRFLATRDRGAVLSFLRADLPVRLPLADRLRMVAGFVATTNAVRAYHTQAELLTVAAAVLRRAGGPGPLVVEAGAGKGASTAKLSRAVAHAGGRLLVYDSFRGIPPNDERHRHLDGRPLVFRAGAFTGRLASVRRTVARFGVPEVCEFHKGWFEETLPGFDRDVDVVLLDVDLLSSTRTCLVHLFPRLRPGGVLFTQDGHVEAVVDLLGDPVFWRDEVGVPPPRIEGLGVRKLLEIRPAPASRPLDRERGR